MNRHILIILIAVSVCWGAVNDRPIIGIVTEPTDGDLRAAGYTEYFAASYVKWIESAGGRAAPIRYTISKEELLSILPQLNGVLFTGGGVSLNGSKYVNTGYEIWNYAIQQDVYFPLWGTCLGFEELCVLSADSSVLEGPFDAENISMALNLTPKGEASEFFTSAPPDVLEILKTESVTMNNHGSGVTPNTFVTNEALKKNWDVLSTNKDRKGVEFVSTISHKTKPFTGTQWHPEKPIFEWVTSEVIPHSYHAILANRYTAEYFVELARHNMNHFSDPVAEKAALIYQECPVYCGVLEPSFRQCYVWK